jgi:hypothetical protein
VTKTGRDFQKLMSMWFLSCRDAKGSGRWLARPGRIPGSQQIFHLKVILAGVHGFPESFVAVSE